MLLWCWADDSFRRCPSDIHQQFQSLKSLCFSPWELDGEYYLAWSYCYSKKRTRYFSHFSRKTEWGKKYYMLNKPSKKETTFNLSGRAIPYTVKLFHVQCDTHFRTVWMFKQLFYVHISRKTNTGSKLSSITSSISISYIQSQNLKQTAVTINW